MTTHAIETIQFAGQAKYRLAAKRESMTIEEAERSGIFADALTLADLAVGYALAAIHDDLFHQKEPWVNLGNVT